MPISRRALKFPCQPKPLGLAQCIPMAWIGAGHGHRNLKFFSSKCHKHVVFGHLDRRFYNFRPAGLARGRPLARDTASQGGRVSNRASQK